MVEIYSNGSKWAGEKADTLEKLMEVLKTHKLDITRFGVFGFVNFTKDNGYSNQQYDQHNVRIHGNFIDVSHVFNIEGKYSELKQIIDAIQNNIESQLQVIE